MKTVMSPAEWSRSEFGAAELGDQRRSERLVQVGAALAQKPRGTLPTSFDSLKEVRAAYRLLESEAVTHQAILEGHCARTQQVCRQPGLYVQIEDTVQLDYTAHAATEGLGRIGDDGGRGLLVHNTLAVQVTGWDEQVRPQVRLVGLSAQQYWTRPPESVRGPQGRRESRSQRLERPRESERWARFLAGQGGLPAHVQWVYVADRESDIYEVFQRVEAVQGDFVIRANQPRGLAAADGSVFSAVAQAPVRTGCTLSLRSRPSQAAREAQLSVRTARVCLRGPWRPGGGLKAQEVNVVEVREENPPPGVEPLHWVLLTSLPLGTLQEVRQVLGFYTCRWTVEEFHKALKSGTQIEHSQLSRARGLAALLAVLSLVALRLVDTKLQARAEPNAPVSPEQFGPEALHILSTKVGAPAGGWTQRTLWRSIARLGGFLGRKCDGEPGWQTIWRGWQRLIVMLEGAELAS